MLMLPQVDKFKYLSVLFTNVEGVEWMIDRRTGVAVTQKLLIVVKTESELSIYIPTFLYGHDLWLVTKRTRSQIQTVEMSFGQRVSGLSLRDTMKSLVIREEISRELQLLCISSVGLDL